MSRKYYLYWIHRPCHTDITTDGYIGVTYDTNQRFKRHRSKSKSSPEYIIHKAINKYPDIEYTVLCEGSFGYILDLEYQLRKRIGIGWNIAIGGNKPVLGIKRSEELNLKSARSSTVIPRVTVLLMMIDHFVKGKTLLDISHIYGVSESSVGPHIHGERLAYPELNAFRDRIRTCPNRTLLSENTYDKIMLSRESGLAVKEISLKFNMTYDVILNICSGRHRLVKSFSCYRPYTQKNIKLTHDGQTHTIKNWSVITGIPCNTIWGRIRSGKSTSETLEVYQPRKVPDLITYNGTQHSCSEWAKILGIHRRTLSDRLKHWSIDDAFNKKVRKRSCKAI